MFIGSLVSMLVGISFNYIHDSVIYEPNRVDNIRSFIYNNKELSSKIFNDNRYRRKLNIIDYNANKIAIFEIPIINKNNLNKETLNWIFSYELNDIIRIIIANNYTFDNKGNII
jgi:hypothetical protein